MSVVTSMPALSIIDGSLSYARPGERPLSILNGLNLELHRGQVLCLTGRSGSGKTTTLKVAHGQKRLNEGEVQWDGVPLELADERALARRRNIFTGFVDQSATLLPGLTLLENVLLPAVPTRQAKSLRRRGRSILTELGLRDRLAYRPSELSGGEAQRGVIARALLMDPVVLIADEPTANLDQENAEIVIQLFRRRADAGRAVLVASHDPLVAESADLLLRVNG